MTTVTMCDEDARASWIRWTAGADAEMPKLCHGLKQAADKQPNAPKAAEAAQLNCADKAKGVGPGRPSCRKCDDVAEAGGAGGAAAQSQTALTICVPPGKLALRPRTARRRP